MEKPPKGLGWILGVISVWVPLKGLYRDYMGIMEKKMETTI